MTSKLCIALALAGAFSVAACGGGSSPAQMRGGPIGGFSGLIAQPVSLLFSDFDVDGDRRVTRAGVEAGAAATWPLLDGNGDGSASALEVADWARVVMGSETATPGRVAMDANADGALSPAELRAGLLVEFDRMDANDDGALDRVELVRVIERGGRTRAGQEAEMELRRGPDGPGGPGGP